MSTVHIKQVYFTDKVNDANKNNITCAALKDEILFELYENDDFTIEYTAKAAISPSFEPRREKNVFLYMRKKDADQLRGDREADQRLCFRYTDSTIPLLSDSEISCL